jgi:hypothetical protein
MRLAIGNAGAIKIKRRKEALDCELLQAALRHDFGVAGW